MVFDDHPTIIKLIRQKCGATSPSLYNLLIMLNNDEDKRFKLELNIKYTYIQGFVKTLDEFID